MFLLIFPLLPICNAFYYLKLAVKTNIDAVGTSAKIHIYLLLLHFEETKKIS